MTVFETGFDHKTLKECILKRKYNISFRNKTYDLFEVDADDFSINFNKWITGLSNKTVKVVINGVTVGKLVLVPYGDLICLMAIPGPDLNYHPMEVDYRLHVGDIQKFQTFRLIVL